MTVIIPVYKVEKYLENCVDSVINQNYEDVQIILVDDGSPDNCCKICDQLKMKYDNILVMHKENGGLSSARNAGIDLLLKNPDQLEALSLTRYVLFLDSDDQLQSGAIKRLIDMAEKTQADMIIPDRYTKVYEDSGKEQAVLHFSKGMYITEPKNLPQKY